MKWIAIVCAAIGLLWTVAFGTLYALGYRWYRFPTGSMDPTIPAGSRAIGYLSDAVRSEVQRFDIVIFEAPSGRGDIYAQRVVGLPGEQISIGPDGIRINGTAITFPEGVSRGAELPKRWDVTVPADSVFVLGDNPPMAADSRIFGSIRLESVVGRILFKR